MLKSHMCIKKPNTKKNLPGRINGCSCVDRAAHSSGTHLEAEPGTPSWPGICSLLCSAGRGSSEAVQDAGPQNSSRAFCFGLDGNQNSSLGRRIWKRDSRQESKPPGKWLQPLRKSSQYTTTGSLKKYNNRQSRICSCKWYNCKMIQGRWS